jgi:hypothetical protein
MTTAALAGAAVAVAAANATPSHGSDPSPVTAASPQATQLEPTAWSTPTSAHRTAVAGHSSSAIPAQRAALPTQRTSAIPAQRAALPPQRGTSTGTARTTAPSSPAAAHPSATPSRTARTWTADHPATAASGTAAPATAPAAVTSAPTAAASAHATADSGAATHPWTGASGPAHSWTGASGSARPWTGASGGGTWQATGPYANAGGSSRPAAQAAATPGQASPAQAPTTQATGDLDTWIKDALVVMADNHIPGSYDGIYRNIMRESSGDPQAINLTDSNAAAGHPSKGLLQVIDPTFQAYHVPGTSMDIYDPVANITAACNYAADFYGSIDNVNGPY